MRLFAVSDIHTDFDENRQWVDSLSRADYIDDTVLLAGDISDVLARVEECFEQFCLRFKNVCFVPGNHDLWVNRCGSPTSLHKLDKVNELCRQYSIQTQRCTIGETEITPLLSWYDYSFGELNDTLRRSWMDFKNCQWPAELSSAEHICRYFLNKNHSLSSSPRRKVSFSHFVPRIDLMPYYIPPKYRFVYPVLGSGRIDTQIRQLQSTIHVYGHSHVNRDIVLAGVRYINNAQGYPSEKWIKSKLLCILEDL